jgi:hypothetical protein
VIEKHCSKQLIFLLKKNNKNLVLQSSYQSKKGKEINANDFTKDKNDDNAFIHKFWKTYKKEIDDVINQLNHLYSVLLNSVKEISFVFKYPFDLIENQREGPKINIETFIKDKFFDIICNDDLIKVKESFNN